MKTPFKINTGVFKKSYSVSELNFTIPTYQWRPWMKDKVFVMKGRTFKIVSGTWICKDGQVMDAIKFESVIPIQENDTPVSVYTMDEKEFFSKLSIDKLR